MKILIVGSGGREHALAWKIKQSPKVKQIFIAPGNGGTAQIGQNVDIAADNLKKLLSFAQKEKIGLTLVGPEIPLALGIVDLFERNNLLIFGPNKKAAQIEASKVFAKRFMKKFRIPTADFKVFSNYQKAKKYLKNCHFPQVLKADGLCGGKGVTVCSSLDEALEALKKLMIEKKFGSAGERLVIEDCLFGQEVSVICFTDGKTILPLLATQDHKPIFDGDKGPNTGGMGAYAPTPLVDQKLMKQIISKILAPTVLGMKKIGRPYKGILYAGLILTSDGPKVLEFNCRFGDPELQPQLMLLKSDLVDLMLACIKGKLKNKKISWYPGFSVCTVLVSKGYPDSYEKGFKIKKLPEEELSNVQVFHAGTRLENGHLVTNGGRVLGVTSRAPSLEEAIQEAYLRVKRVKFKNKYCRTDIGAKAFDYLVKKVNRIEISSKTTDTRTQVLKKDLEKAGFAGKIEGVWLDDVYTIDKRFGKADLKKIASMLVNPITQKASINRSQIFPDFSWVVEIGFLPGVTDNVANTAKENIEDLLKVEFSQEEGVYSSQLIFIKGRLSQKEISLLSNGLINPIIQRVRFKDKLEFEKEKGMEAIVPKVKLEAGLKVKIIDLNVSDEELAIIGKQGIVDEDGKKRGPLALRPAYMKAIQQYFKKKKRDPTDIELESIAQTWSEHCKHTIFADPIDGIKKGLFKTYIKGATEEINSDICVSVFTDNSGAIVFDKDWLITDKVETHNSPSALDPFGGSITGIVGVNRDTIGFGLGAKPIANRYGFMFAEPKDQTVLYKGPHFTQKMLSGQRIMEGVIRGVNVGGNCSGIPTPQGFTYFDKNYRGKPLVFVGTVGLIPRKNGARRLDKKKAQKGDYIVMTGGRVGQDGIHGATFSSEAMDAGSPAGAVQIGDPITQKKLSDAVIKEARDQDLYHSITDNGAGGLSCSVAEMAKECGGCRVELDKVPLKYPGLAPWQTWISESQERMTLAVPPEKCSSFLRLMRRRGVEATVIGRFTDSERCVVKYRGKKIMDLEMKFLHHGLPSQALKTTFTKKNYPEPEIPLLSDLTRSLHLMLKRPNIASFEFISSQYDHEVQGGAVIKPLQGRGRVNGEATVIRPVLSSQKGIVLSQGVNPSYSQIDTYNMAACSIDTAIRNAVSVGADLDHLALLDNFCWCSSDEPERLGQLKRAAQACYDYAIVYGTPFISGKDSMFNDFKGYNKKGEKIKVSILPTLLISSIGVIKDVVKAVSMEVKFPGDLVYILGETFEELGGSEYFRMRGEQKGKDYIGNHVPKVDAKKNKKLYQALSKAIQKELVSSSCSVGRGGLGVTLAKTALAGQLGLKISLKNLPGKFSRNDYGLFSESQGRIVVTIDPEKQKEFEKIMTGNPFGLIGKVTKEELVVIRDKDDQVIVDLDLNPALDLYQSAFDVLEKGKVQVLVLSGYGINCEEETAHAFELAGASADIVHINDLIDGYKDLNDYQILSFPGGFSYGDDTGSGNAFANRVRNHLWEEVVSFIKKDHLVIGICNGFQIMVNLGLLPALAGKYGQREAALTHNNNARYTVRWVDLEVGNGSPWLKGMKTISLPIAHGEGRFSASGPVLKKLGQKNLIALKYVKGKICQYQDLEANPNGSLEDIAGITDESGRLLGLMPHPERAIFFTHLPNWPLIKERRSRLGKKIPEFGPGLQIFKNGVKYFE